MIEKTIDIYCDSCGKKCDVIVNGIYDNRYNVVYYKSGSKKFLVSIDVSAIDYENSIPQGTKERTDLCDTCIKKIIASIDPEKLKSSRSRALMEDT